MKKKIVMALILGLCVAATGCSQKTEKNKTTTEAATEAVTTENTEASNAASEGSESGTEGAETSTEASTKESEAVRTEEPDYKALDHVTLGQYKALEVEVSSLEVTEDDIQEQYYTDCTSHDKLVQVTEGQVADGDVTNIDYVGSVDGVEFDGGTDKGVDLTIGSGRFIPGFEEGLIGASIGGKVDVNVTFPTNYRETSLAGKDAVFAVTVNHVKKTPEMTDELVAEISDQKTVAEYRKAVEEQLKATKVSQQESEKINGILNLLYSGSKINSYPQEVVDYRVALMKDYYKQIAEQAGQEFADFLSTQLQMTEEQFDEQCPVVVQQSMIQELLLKAVAESEDMELTDEEYEAGLDRYVANTGSESKETLLSQYSEDEVRRSILMDKALDFLKENTTVKVKGETDEEGETEGSSDTAQSEETEAASTEAPTEAPTTEAPDTESNTESDTTESVSETNAE